MGRKVKEGVHGDCDGWDEDILNFFKYFVRVSRNYFFGVYGGVRVWDKYKNIVLVCQPDKG